MCRKRGSLSSTKRSGSGAAIPRRVSIAAERSSISYRRASSLTAARRRGSCSRSCLGDLLQDPSGPVRSATSPCLEGCSQARAKPPATFVFVLPMDEAQLLPRGDRISLLLEQRDADARAGPGPPAGTGLLRGSPRRLPTLYASMRPSLPFSAIADPIGLMILACGPFSGWSTDSTSPPWNATFCRKTLQAEPSASFSLARVSPVFGSGQSPPSVSIQPARRNVRSISSAGPLPCRQSIVSSTSRKLPIFLPQRPVHVRDEGHDGAAQAGSRCNERARQGPRLVPALHECARTRSSRRRRATARLRRTSST